MVFKSLTLFARSRGPDEFWRKRKIFKMSAHFHNRRRNCYSIAIKGVHRALMYCFRGRRLKRQQFHELWDTRLAAACSQHGISSKILLEGLSRNEILLNRKALVDLAIWEPRTFKSLAKVAWARCKIDGLNMVKELPLPSGIITRGMLK
ncbi:39S ribosomal protein L20, mitochondrial [Microplitis demolitor]|uniref:39S ribosomal protein L20, mitochondrial n=1 Tax=Microplitis demolitor TaxID=69319 RepID=UPI00044000D2|nr:39S ribosomal protein L20, mitochondrial [Microplitis demolitor]